MMRRTAANLLPDVFTSVVSSSAPRASSSSALPKLRIRTCSSMTSLYPSNKASAAVSTTSNNKKRKRRPLTLRALQRKYDSMRKLTMITAYDATMASLAQDAELDMILVGDSLGMVMNGLDNTVPVTLEEIVYHCKSVTRTVDGPLVIGDMPFGTYMTVNDALRSGAQLMKEGGVAAVKLEGGMAQRRKVRALTDEGIAVVGHIGLTPQTVHADGGYRFKGHSKSEQDELLEAGLALEDAGARMLVLECVPADVAADITSALSIPTIGIGSGPDTSGQVLVMHDALGLYKDSFKFAKRYVEGRDLLSRGLKDYVAEIQSGAFPAPEHYVKSKAPAKAVPTSKPSGAARSPPGRTLTSGLKLSSPPTMQARGYSTAAVVGGGPLGVSVASRLAGVMDTVLISDSVAKALDVTEAAVVDTGDVVTLTGNAGGSSDSTSLRVLPTSTIVDGVSISADLVVSCVSGHGVPKAGAVAGKVLSDDDSACVVSLTNGMGHSRVLASCGHVSGDRIVEGVTYEGARRLEETAGMDAGAEATVVVERTGAGATQLVGGMDVQGHKFGRAVKASMTLAEAGFDSSLEADDSCLWTKLIVNAVINPLTTVFRVPNGSLLQWMHADPGAYSFVQSLTEEGVRVAARAGVTLDERAVMGAVTATATATATNTSSMLSAVLGGRPTELHWLNDFLLDHAKAHDVACPSHILLRQAVAASEAAAPFAATAADNLRHMSTFA